MNKTQKILETALKEMHKRVGIKYTGIPTEDDWYLKHTWTREEQTDYREWLIRLLRTKLKMTKKMALRESDMFILSYGWREENERIKI